MREYRVPLYTVDQPIYADDGTRRSKMRLGDEHVCYTQQHHSAGQSQVHRARHRRSLYWDTSCFDRHQERTTGRTWAANSHLCVT